MFDVKAMAESFVKTVRDHVSASITPLAKRVDDLDMAIKAIPAGRDGAAGVDGKDAVVDYERIAADMATAIKDVTDAIPVPKDGKDADPEAVRGMVAAEVAKAIAALPEAKDGAPGRDGTNGIDGKDARDGRDGLAGMPGLPGERGTDGINGKDGFSLDHLNVVLADDGRTLTMILHNDDTAVEKSITLPIMIYRGVYKTGTDYVRGDTVTWDGSTWHCEIATKAEPGNGADWRLIVKRGTPGKDGPKGERGEKGIDGRNGRDLTQMTSAGLKY